MGSKVNDCNWACRICGAGDVYWSQILAVVIQVHTFIKITEFYHQNEWLLLHVNNLKLLEIALAIVHKNIHLYFQSFNTNMVYNKGK